MKKEKISKNSERLAQMEKLLGRDNFEKLARHFAGRRIYLSKRLFKRLSSEETPAAPSPEISEKEVKTT